jgi:hypothetical protein
MSDLGPDAKGLIEQVGDGDGPSRADRERVRRLVSAGLAAASTAATTASLAAGAAGTAGTSLAKSVGIAQLALWVGVGSAVGAAVSAPVLLADATPPRPAAVESAAAAVDRRPKPRARVAVPAPLASIEEPAQEAAAETPPPAVPRHPPPKPPPKPAEAANTAAFPTSPVVTEGGLRAETRLLEQAQRARAAGRTDEALRILSTYGTHFPGGVLRSESLVMRVLCLCELGRHGEAQALAEELLRLHPESPLVPRLSRSCVTLPAG